MTDSGLVRPIPNSVGTRSVRKKTTEACERCREKRIKCNGLQPCDQCGKKAVQCIFAPAPMTVGAGHMAISEKLDLILSRLDKLEHQIGCPASNVASDSEHAKKPRSSLPDSKYRGVAQLNQQTGCFEYYGQTSTFVIASSLGKRLRQLEDTLGRSATAKLRRTEPSPSYPASDENSSKNFDLNELTSFCDYVVPSNVLRSDRYLREDVADRHLESFFRTIHVLIPILDPKNFKARYVSLRRLFGDRRLILGVPDDPDRPQFVCLLHAVLALGALYEDEQGDNPSWASWYFAEAQDMLGRLLDASNLQLVQAAMFLGAYAQHVIKPNLAYVLTGMATRLAYSVGLNIESFHRSLGFDMQEARRTWAIIYIQEIELALDAGRPISIRSSDMAMNYPTVELLSGDNTTSDAAQVVFIRYLAELAKLIRKILNLTDDFDEQSSSKLEERETMRQQLESWRASLPKYLSFDESLAESFQSSQPASLYDWRARQQSSLRIHYNITIIVLMRSSTSNKMLKSDNPDRQSLMTLHHTKCLDAARDMISHIHQSFELAPSLRRWSYYCFYCLQATLVLLTKLADDRSSSRYQSQHGDYDTWSGSQPAQDDDLMTDEESHKLCSLAIDIFEKINIKASQRCANVVRRFLENWAKLREEQRTDRAETHHASHDKTLHASQEWCTGPPSTSHSSALLSTCTACPTNPTGASYKTAQTTGTARGSLNCAENADAVNDHPITSAPVSLGEIQAELYGALCGKDVNEGFYPGQHPYSLGFEGSGDVALELDTEFRVTDAWFHCDNLHSYDA